MSLAILWDGVEKEEFEKQRPKWQDPAAQEVLFHFRPSSLTRKCPGVRCDGMHFSSDYREYGCRGSSALWDAELARFLLETFPDRRPGLDTW